jgi:type II secretory pathway pseudopilin PulG
MLTISSSALSSRFRARSGSILLELLVSAALLASLLVIVNQSFVGLRRQSRLVDRRFVAQQVLENVMEEYTQQSWDTLSTESIQKITLPELAVEKLPHCKITGIVVDESDPVLAKRIILRLLWDNHPGRPSQSIGLTSWSFAPEGDQR